MINSVSDLIEALNKIEDKSLPIYAFSYLTEEIAPIDFVDELSDRVDLNTSDEQD